MREWSLWWASRPPVPCWLRWRAHLWEGLFTANSLQLRCVRCHAVTPGWSLPGPAPRALPPETFIGRIRWWTWKVRHDAPGG